MLVPRLKIKILGLTLVTIATFAAFSGETTFAQKSVKKEVVFTKVIIPTYSQDCRIELVGKSLSPSATECLYADHLKSGSQLTIVSRKKSSGWVLLKLRSDSGVEFDFYVENRSNVSFNRLFASVFSAKKVESEYPGCSFRTIEEIIKTVGFPNRISRDNGKERWTFNADYVAYNFCNFDVTYVDFESGKVKQISGLI